MVPLHPDLAAAEHAATQAEQRARRQYTPRPHLSLREWAEKFRRFPGGIPFRLDLVPHLTEILDAYSDPLVREMTVLKCSQGGATEGLLLNAVGYHMHQEPRNILAVIPSVDEAEKWSRKKLQTSLIEPTEILHGRLASKSRSSDNTMLEKRFPGGSLGIIGSNSGRGFRMVTMGVVLSDDVNGWERRAGKDGDQVTLIRRRVDRIHDRKVVWVSTPTLEGERIETLYDRMERRGRYHMACPECGAYQVFRWGGPKEPHGLKWDQVPIEDGYRPAVGEIVRGDKVHRPDTAYYLCEANACVIEESHRIGMARGGTYLDEDGRHVMADRPQSVGFWFSALDLILAGAEWPKLIREYLEIVDDQEALQTFHNLVLALTWTPKAFSVSTSALEARAALYQDARGKRIEVPDGVGVLVGFADVQHDRIELLVVGFGGREIGWMIAHHRIYGDTSQPAPWQVLESLRSRQYRHASGTPMSIEALGVDSGDGSRQAEVYDWVKPRQGMGVWACKGQAERQKEAVRIALQRSKKKRTQGIRLVHIGTHILKSTLFSRLALAWQPDAGPPPHGYLHMRGREPDWHSGADSEFFAQFGREKKFTKRLSNGRRRSEWRASGPNEAIDLFVGCLAMLHVLGPPVRDTLEERAERARSGAPVQAQQRPQRRVISRGIR